MKKFTLLTLLSTFGVFAQDNCADAVFINEGTHTVEMINGPNIPNPDCSRGDTVATVAEWYAFTATVNGVVNVSTVLESNSADTRINIYTGSCESLVCYAHNDDASPENFEFGSNITFRSVAETTYYITFDNGWDNGGFDFTVAEFPVDCATSLPFATLFEDSNSLIGCYEIEDNDGNGVSWMQQAFDFNLDGIDETFCVNGSNGINPKDDWLFSPSIAMEAGITYMVSYTYNGRDQNTVNMSNETMQVVIADSPSSSAEYMEQIALHENILQTGTNESLKDDATTNTLSFTPTSSGNYHLGFNTSTAENGGFLLLFGYSVEVELATPEFESNLTIYPNPVVDNITIAQLDVIDTVEIFNLLGQKVMERSFRSSEVNLDLSHLTSGAYVAKVITGNTSRVVKVIKQ